MPKWAKNILWTLLVLFIIYYIFTQPEQFASGVHSLVHSLTRLFDALAR